MRALIAFGLTGIVATMTAAHDHHRNRCPLVGYGPVNPFGYTMSADLYTTDMAPSFREFRGGGIRAGTPVNSTDQQKRPPVQPRQGSIPGIVLPPPSPIPNPQLTPPPAGTPSNSPPPAPTPASVKPSSAAGSGS